MISSWRRCQTYYSANRIITCNKSLDLLTLKENCVLVSGFSYKDFHSFGELHHFEVDINNLKLWSIMKCVSYACIAFWDDFKTITMLVHELKWTLDCKLHCKWNAFRDIYHVHYKCMMCFIRIIVCSVYQGNMNYMYMF